MDKENSAEEIDLRGQMLDAMNEYANAKALKADKTLQLNQPMYKYFIEDVRTGKWLRKPTDYEDIVIDTRRTLPEEDEIKWTNDPNQAIIWDTFEEAESYNKKYWNMVDIEVTEHEFVNANPSDNADPVQSAQKPEDKAIDYIIEEQNKWAAAKIKEEQSDELWDEVVDIIDEDLIDDYIPDYIKDELKKRFSIQRKQLNQ